MKKKRIQPPHREGPKPKEKIQPQKSPRGDTYLALRAMSCGSSLPAKKLHIEFMLKYNKGTIPDSAAAGIPAVLSSLLPGDWRSVAKPSTVLKSLTMTELGLLMPAMVNSLLPGQWSSAAKPAA